MRRIVIALSCLVVVLGACGSAEKAASPGTTPVSDATTSSTGASTSSSVSIPTATTPVCPKAGSTDPRHTPAAQPAALLTDVAITTAGCRDSVTFTFEKSGTAVPSCTVEYKSGPFTRDASGKPIAVSGTAFVSVRCEPAYGYDFVTSTPTYTGPKRVTATGTEHVTEVVETGDFEGVLNWVIGLDGQRPFGITAGGVPARQLTITFS
jgi:hypothetical protein